jgi:hypothetical protein
MIQLNNEWELHPVSYRQSRYSWNQISAGCFNTIVWLGMKGNGKSIVYLFEKKKE